MSPRSSRAMAFFILAGPRYGIVLGLLIVFLVFAVARPGEIDDRVERKLAAAAAAIKERRWVEARPQPAVPLLAEAQIFLEPGQPAIPLWARSLGSVVEIQRSLQAGRLKEAERQTDDLLRVLGLDPARFTSKRPDPPFPLLLGIGILFGYNSAGFLLIEKIPLGILAVALTICDIGLALVAMVFVTGTIGAIEQILLLPGLFSLAVLYGPRVSLLAMLVYAAVEGIGMARQPLSLVSHMHLVIFPLIFVTLLFYIAYITEMQRKSDAALLAKSLLEERQSLARELHDGLGASVATISTGLEVARKRLAKDPNSARDALESLAAVVKQFYRALKDMTHLYRTDVLDESLGSRIRAYVHDLVFSEPLEITVKVIEAERALPSPVALSLFRIVQEGLQNIVAHASARSAEVTVRYDPREVELVIRDDGHGFEIKEEGSGDGGLGLRHMRERAERLGGTCHIESAPGRGTALTVRIPDRLTPV